MSNKNNHKKSKTTSTNKNKIMNKNSPIVSNASFEMGDELAPHKAIEREVSKEINDKKLHSELRKDLFNQFYGFSASPQADYFLDDPDLH